VTRSIRASVNEFFIVLVLVLIVGPDGLTAVQTQSRVGFPHSPLFFRRRLPLTSNAQRSRTIEREATEENLTQSAL
jgi:hypothetical protein